VFDLIEAIILSDFLIFIVFSIMLGAVTLWTLRENEYLGYALGWLVGIFFIVIYVSVTGDPTATEAVEEAAEDTETRLELFAVMLPAFLGLLFGFGVLFIVKMYSGSGTRRSLVIAVLTAILVGVLFFLATADDYARRLIGIFALAFAIGSLTTMVLGIGSKANAPQNRRQEIRPPGAPRSTQDIPVARIPDTPESRLDSIRRMFGGGGDK